MNTQKIIPNTAEDLKVNVKLKLALLWVSLIFLYIYVDYFHLYMPNKIEDIKIGRDFKFSITEGFLLSALVSITIPILMIFLSVVLPAKVNRLINIAIAAVYIPFTLLNLAGETWMHMIFSAVVEIVILSLIILYAWKWSGI